MPKAKLDHMFAATAECEPGKAKTDWYDTTITGFVLECRSSGGKTYYLRYQDAAGRQKQFKIGRYQDVRFPVARKAAEELRSKIVLGEDPGAKKAEAKAVPLYRDLAEMHLADAKLTQRSFSTTDMYVRRHIIPKWGRTPVSEIDARAVTQWLADKRAEGLAPATVEKLRVLLGRSFELGSRWGIPGCEKNPTRGITRKPLNNARNRYLTAQEAARLREAVAAVPEPPAAAHRGPVAADGCSGERTAQRPVGACRC
jgi:hypothetical protein